MKIDYDQNEVRIEIEGLVYNLHPLWIRERSNEENMVDQNSLQRLYDPEKLPVNLKISDLTRINKEKVRIKFSDDHAAEYCLKSLSKELQRSKGLPEKILWDNSNIELKNFEFNYDENEDDQLLKILHYYHQYGFVLVSGLDPKDGEIINFANKIGYIRETNFGKLFNVVSQKQPNDLAYTSIELESHTDNPYRKPVPSIQFLFCIENSCEGGDSTVVDGFKVASDLKDKKPEVFETLSKTLINFKFKDKDAILEKTGKIINLSERGELKQIKYSNRLDFVFYQKPEQLERFYESKRLMHEMINSDKYVLKFHLDPGSLLIMNNYRTLHGRTSYNTSEGSRWLQGLYIDHDSAESKYKLLAHG